MWKITLLAWLITVVMVSFFVVVIIPAQKQIFFENLESKANSVAVSIRDVASGAVVTEDYGALVEHCLQILKGDKSIEYLVITRNDGESWIHEQSGWRYTTLDDRWHPTRRVASSGISTVPTFNRQVFHYSQPFDYSGIQWGWIHVGLSLESYNRSVASVYRRTGLLALICVLLSFFAAGFFAKFLVSPILNLQTVVQRVARGDLAARATIHTGDEVESLAESFNVMAGSLLQRDKILGGVQFASQQFLAAPDWQGVAVEVLTRIGQAAGVSRAYISPSPAIIAEGQAIRAVIEYTVPAVPRFADSPLLQNHPARGANSGPWTENLREGRVFSGNVCEMSPADRLLLAPLRIQSLIMVPIHAEGLWWGCLGFDDCVRARSWTDAEVDSLRALADMLGATITRKQVQDALLDAKQTLEQRVDSRTRELQEQVVARRRSEEDKERILATAQMGIIIVDRRSGRIRYINTTAEKLIRRPAAAIFGEQAHRAMFPGESDAHAAPELLPNTERTECILVDGEGNQIPVLKSVVAITYNEQPCLLESFIDLTERKQAEQALDNLHKELLIASREAGMAEVATGVLHNVGNVLNSVNVSTTLIREKIQRSEILTLARLSNLLRQHQADMNPFLTSDPKGRLIPGFIIELADGLEREQDVLKTELDLLARNVEHIKEIVAMQQTYARISGFLEQVSITTIVEHALQMNSAGLARHGISLFRRYSLVPPVTVDRHKVLQILINLIHNAKYALRDSRNPDKQLIAGIGLNGDQGVVVTVTDNGVGILPENLTRIFSHGFTTRKDGHGFGLHSGANAAREMGGELTVRSEGINTGATFTLKLPFKPQPADS